jgi:hypothetical protein
MNELRRELLQEGDPPEELSPDLRFLASRQASLVGLLLDHVEVYRVLIERTREEGLSPELQAAALDAAGNLGTLLQSLRTREDLQAMLAHAPDFVPTPMFAIDQLLYSFVLLSAPCNEDELLACLAPGSINGLFASNHFRTWVHGFGALGPGE